MEMDNLSLLPTHCVRSCPPAAFECPQANSRPRSKGSRVGINHELFDTAVVGSMVDLAIVGCGTNDLVCEAGVADRGRNANCRHWHVSPITRMLMNLAAKISVTQRFSYLNDRLDLRISFYLERRYVLSGPQG